AQVPLGRELAHTVAGKWSAPTALVHGHILHGSVYRHRAGIHQTLGAAIDCVPYQIERRYHVFAQISDRIVEADLARRLTGQVQDDATITGQRAFDQW